MANINFIFNNNCPMAGGFTPPMGRFTPMGRFGGGMPPLFQNCFTPFAPCPPSNGALEAGLITGAALGFMANPGALRGLGKIITTPFKWLGQGAKWTYKNILKPTGKFLWNNAIKPAGQFMWNKVLKPVGQWIGGLFSKKS